MSITIELPPGLEEILARDAARHGETLAERALHTLQASVLADRMPEGPQDLQTLAEQQGAPCTVHFDDLLGDFWPEDETCDEFIAAVRSWRRESSNGQI